MEKEIKVFFVQMTSRRDISENLKWIEGQFHIASTAGANIVVLPEMFAQFGVADQHDLAKDETEFRGPVGTVIRSLAKKYGVWVIAGTVPVLTDQDERPRARCHVIDAKGCVISYYDKIHLFDAVVGDKQGAYKESDSYSPGDEVVTFLSPWGEIGLAVCYDLRFPELFRRLNDAGAEMVIVPAAFTYKTGQAHWEILCRSRAIENGFFIAAVNQCGQHDKKRATWGHSMMVDPWGDMSDMGEDIDGRLFTVDLNNIKDVRLRLPVNQHRRLL